MVLQRGRRRPRRRSVGASDLLARRLVRDASGCHRRLVEHEVRIQQVVTHGNAFGIYFFDPEGNRNEFYWSTGVDVQQPFRRTIDVEINEDDALQKVAGVHHRRSAQVSAGHMTATILLPVVVVGAGPTGLTLAGLLAAAGTPTILVEHNPSTSSVPKAISCEAITRRRALRALTRGRLAYTLDSVLIPGVGTKYLGAYGQTLVYARSQDPPRFGHPVKSPFSQPDFERELLAGIVRAGGVDLRFGTTVTGLVQDSNGVTVAIRSADGSEQAVRASYVVGCDGGRSTIRGLLGVKMRGESFSDRWLVVDTANDPHNDRYAIHVGNPHRPHVIVAGRDATCRYEFLSCSRTPKLPAM